MRRNLNIGAVSIKLQAYFTLVKPLIEYAKYRMGPIHTSQHTKARDGPTASSELHKLCFEIVYRRSYMSAQIVYRGSYMSAQIVYRGSYMSAQILLNLLNKLRKRENARQASHFICFSQ